MRQYIYFLFLFSLFISVGACRKKANLFASEAERQRLKEEAEDLLAIERDKPRGDNELLYFELQGQIDRTKYKGDSLFVHIKRPDYLSATELLRISDLVVSEGAISQPDMGDQVDVSKPFPITVTAANGNKRTYIVSATFTQESGNEILQYVVQGQDKRRNPTQFHGDSIIVFLDHMPANSRNSLNLNTDILKISPNATITPGQGQVQNFCNPISYTVTSESGKKREYKVYVRVRFQLPNNNFENWYSTTFISGRGHTGPYQNLGRNANERQGWTSFNDGYYAITGIAYKSRWIVKFPVDRYKINGNSYVDLTTREYQNTATAFQDLPFGISPGAIFTGKLTDYDERGGVSTRNYKRGTMQLEPITLPLDCAKAARPKSFAFKYKYLPSYGDRKSYNQNCRSTWAWWSFSYQNNPDCNATVSGKDQMEVHVLLLDNSKNIIGLGAFRSPERVSSVIRKTVQFHYKNDNLNNEEQQLVNNKRGHTGNWANNDAQIAKVLVVITASYDLWGGSGGTPVGAVGSQLLFDELIMEY